jgi:glycosyltransferase involved in cell wall biosynthesis
MAPEYASASGPLKKALLAPWLHYLRLWDRLSADRVDHFVANSENVRRRILKHYRREATVIHPPVDTESYHLSDEQDDYYLLAGQLVGYKRADLAVRAFNDFGRRLVVIGEGEELRALRSMAGANVEFLGWQPDHVLSRYYARCRALIFPGEEDFGMVPVEAMAAGRPVIALARGGALETVIEGETGLFFKDQTVDSLRATVLRFEAGDIVFDPQRIREHALTFGRERFRNEIIKTVNNFLSR